MPRSEHTMIGGASDGGKTTLLREMHHRAGGPVDGTGDGVSIFVNHGGGTGDDHTDNVAGYVCEGEKACYTAFEKFEKWGDVRINLKVSDPIECMTIARNVAVNVHDTTRANRPEGPVPVQICVPEAGHIYPSGEAHDKSNNPGLWVLVEGRDKGIKLTQEEQNPQKLPKEDNLNFRWWVWCGEWAEANKGWMKYYGFDPETLPGERFEYAVFNRQMDRVGDGTTKERFA